MKSDHLSHRLCVLGAKLRPLSLKAFKNLAQVPDSTPGSQSNTMPSSNAQYTALADSATAAATAIAADPRFGFLQKLREERLGQLRPLNDFFDKNRISRPTSAAQISSRLNYNLQYYKSNYFVILIGLLLYALITNLFLLVVIVLLVGGLQYISRQGPEPLVIGGATITSSQMYAALIGLSIPLLWISSAGSTVFWIVGAAAVIIGGHAAFLEPSIEGDFASGPITV